MSKTDGGPAFPIFSDDPHDMHVESSGMSLRDYFAGQALQGITACIEHTGIIGQMAKDAGEDNALVLAATAYSIAQAMINWRANINVDE